MEKSILYLNQNLVPNLAKETTFENKFDWGILEARHKFDFGMPAWYLRKGHNFMPFNNNIGKRNEFSMPDFDPVFNKTFEEVTDSRFQDLKNNYFDKPWHVQWSGGIDSTLMICALLKNLNQSDYENVTVLCNYGSIFENPKFYNECIKPNFKTQNSSHFISPDQMNNVYTIDGELGDQIYGHRYSVFLADSNLATASWKNNSNDLIEFISKFSDNTFAKWLYQGMKHNIESCDAPVENCQDWLWWMGFNITWISIVLRTYIPHQVMNNISYTQHLKHRHHWFDSFDYQQWAMNNNNSSSSKYDPFTHKISSKIYIESVWPDQHFRKYKTKVDSVTRQQYSIPSSEWACLLNDMSCLYYPADSEDLQNLVESHLNI